MMECLGDPGVGGAEEEMMVIWVGLVLWVTVLLH